MSDETTPSPEPIQPDPSTNGGSPAADAAVGEQLAGAAALALTPRTGHEAVWSFPPEAVRPQPNFGSWPTSPVYVDPDARRRILDVTVAALIALLCAVLASMYVTDVLGNENQSKPPISQTEDPFAIGDSGGGLP